MNDSAPISDAERATWNVGYHPPQDDGTAQLLGEIRELFVSLIEDLEARIPERSREKSIMLTDIENACMYAMAAIVRNQ